MNKIITESHRLSAISQALATRIGEEGLASKVFTPAEECAHAIYKSGHSAHRAIEEGMIYAHELNGRMVVSVDKLREEGL